MNSRLLFLVLSLCSVISYAQAPQGIKYQAVVRDDAGDFIQDQTVSLRISILEGSAAGTIVYQETFSVMTNEFGLASIEIGNGTPVIGTFPGIDWGNGEHFIETELDPDGGSTYTSMGTSQMLSVAYALHAGSSGDTRWDTTGNDLYYNDGKVGIGLTSPEGDFHVAKNPIGAEGLFGTNVATFSQGTGVSIGNDIDDAVLYIGQSTNNKGYFAWDFNSTPEDGYLTIGGYGGVGDLILQELGGRVGIGLTSPEAGLHVATDTIASEGIFGDKISYYHQGTTVSIGNENDGALLYVGQSFSRKGYIRWDQNPTPDDAYLSIGVWGNSINDLVLQENGGKVGLGTTNPLETFHVVGGIYQDFTQSFTGSAVFTTGASSTQMYYIENTSDNGHGIYSAINNPDAPYYTTAVIGYNDGAGRGVSGESNNGNGVYGINWSNYNFGFVGTPGYGVYGENSNGNYAGLGTDNYGVYAFLNGDNPGDFAVFGSGPGSLGGPGTGYNFDQAIGGITGYNSVGFQYTFGVAGYTSLDEDRAGSIFGASIGSLGVDKFGCLAYQASGGSEYGGYFTSYTTGSGKDNEVKINNGIGVWGDLFGADIHGKVYGAFIEGENYATFTSGDNYTNGLDIHLQEDNKGENKVLYTHVSTEATIQTSGYATLTSGESEVLFDQTFADAVSSDAPIIVTVTPVGNSNGVYLAEVSRTGFKVAENNGGKSNVSLNYIAIGKRAGHENPQLPTEVIASDYTSKLERGLHNDADTQTEGEGLYYENGELFVGIHPSTFADPNIAAREEPSLERPQNPENTRIEVKRPEISKPDRTPRLVKAEDNMEGSNETQDMKPKVKDAIPEKTSSENKKPNYKTYHGGPVKK